MSKENTKKDDRKFLIFLGILTAVCILVRLFVAEPFRVSGGSMSPTFRDGDCVLAEQVSVYAKHISRGDIVIVEYPNGRLCIKRVIGTGGDTIEIKNGLLLLNGEEVQEEYICDDMYYSMDPIAVEDNTFFVMGDNRNFSNDSRNPDVGVIPYDKIKGKVCFRIFPLGKKSAL